MWNKSRCFFLSRRKETPINRKNETSSVFSHELSILTGVYLSFNYAKNPINLKNCTQKRTDMTKIKAFLMSYFNNFLLASLFFKLVLLISVCDCCSFLGVTFAAFLFLCFALVNYIKAKILFFLNVELVENQTQTGLKPDILYMKCISLIASNKN